LKKSTKSGINAAAVQYIWSVNKFFGGFFMVIEKKKPMEKVKSALLKIGKRNMIIMAAVLLIGAAVWMNWMLFADNSSADGAGDGLANVSGNAETEAEGDTYFATMQVSRKRARDEALEVLQSVVDNTDADEAVKAQALTDINRLALEMNAESNIETLVMAKGFEDCVAVINGDTATVVVKAKGETLLANEIAQINEIVYEQAKIDPVNIKITER
jgi:stage III sporulation protein AH